MKQLVTAILLGSVLLFEFSGCIPVERQPAPSSESGEPSASSERTPEESALAGMTLKEKVGQLFVLAYRKDENKQNLTALNQTAIDEMTEIQPGGIILFGENIASVEQVRNFIVSAKQTARYPLFVSVDQEGGSVQRITKTDSISATALPPMYQVGLTKDPALAKKVGNVLGSELSVFGFNMDFAPDCDVFSNPNNTVIGHRAFSSDPEVVAQLSVMVSQGLREENVIPVAKHFPGHGDTDADTHLGYAVSNKTIDELWKTELIPFKAQIKTGVSAVMVSHISLPAVNGDNTPASLSRKVITGLLRQKMGYQGLVITDSLAMGAIVQNYTAEKVPILALEAGADLLLMPENPKAAHNAVLSAVKDGTLSEARIDESVLRILKVKYEYGLFHNRPLSDSSILGCAEHQAVVKEIEEKQP